MESPLPDPDRRRFLRLGFQGGVAVGGALVVAGLSGCSVRPAHDPMVPATEGAPERQWHFMTEADRVVMAALLPAIVGSGMPRETQARNAALSDTLVAMDEAFHAMGPPNQRQFRQLFDLLESSITRLTLARVSSYWPNVSNDQAEAFLQRWRSSMFNTFNQAYLGLVQVSNAAWYGQPSNWGRMGYPGPPAYTYDALPQMQPSSA
ncbi:hypothetical protein [Salicola sp. Rm-C-2C1-2]|uniref:hypothetical protein n=1 Tax=Salicola sp. Rm-C-2C1-2 TaxID=3141321 RepID=UPI0032E5227E